MAAQPSIEQKRYPAILGLTSACWVLIAWAVASLAPHLAFVPAIGAIHLLMPAVTTALILLNLRFSAKAIWRGVSPSRLVVVTALQIGLFTALFFQIAAHLGAEHYKLDGPVRPWEWVGFSIAHALRAFDLLDTVEAYGLSVQSIRHDGPLVACVLVVYHVVVDLFLLRALWAVIGAWKSRLLRQYPRARSVSLAAIAFAFMWWAGFAFYLICFGRPWRLVDVPLWLVENLVRVIDFGDVMDSFDLHWHQAPRGWQESTLTFFCRVWIALGVAAVLSRRKPAEASGTSQPWSTRAVLWPATAVVLCAAVAVAADRSVSSLSDPCAELVAAAVGVDDRKAERALSAIRLMGPNAASTIEPLSRSRPALHTGRRHAITHTIGFLGVAALPTLEALTSTADEEEAITAARGLGRIGPTAAPALVRAWKDAPQEAARAAAGEALRSIGAAGVPHLVATLTNENSAEYHDWLVELDRNWALQPSQSDLFHAVVEVHARKAYWQRAAQDAGAYGLRELSRALTTPGDSPVLAAEAIGQMGADGQKLIPVLMPLAGSRDPKLRQTVVRSLEGIDPRWRQAPDARRAVDTFKQHLQSGDPATREGGISGLKALRATAVAAAPSLVAALAAEPENGLQDDIAEAMVAIGPSYDTVGPLLVQLLGHGEEQVRWAAADVLLDILPAQQTRPQELVEFVKQHPLFESSRRHVREANAAIRSQRRGGRQ